MCVEGLSAIIRRNEEAGLLHGCRIVRGAPVISHLLFADDCYLFFKATGTEANVMKRILDRYAEISGQIINYNKSAITFSSNTGQVDRDQVCEQLQVQVSEQPGKYLGMPMHIGRRKKSVFAFLVDRVEKKLQTWSLQNISKAGKVTLLKTAAQSVPNFWMNLLLIPLDVCDSIEKKMNAYWWGGGQNQKGIKWMAWDRLCEAKEGGGLGFKKLRDFNLAMLAKQAWRLINNANPLVTSFMKARYYADTEFLDANLGVNPSFMWRSILAAKEVVKQGGRKRIGDGKDTRVWKIPWLPCKENGCVTSECYQELEKVTVSTLMQNDPRSWDEDILRDLFNERDRQLILQVPLSSRVTYDSWYWDLDNDGDFTVRSCYRKLRGERDYENRSFWKKLWGLKLPGKVLNFLWRACRNVLPTAQALVSKHVNVQSICSWCQYQLEDTMHTLVHCCFAKEVWQTVGVQDLCQATTNTTFMEILKQVFDRNNNQQCARVGMFCWGLWVRRNSWVWDKKNISAFGVKAMVENLLQEWQRAQEEIRTCPANMQGRKWCRPPQGWIKINVDAAYCAKDRVGGAGCVIRDDQGTFLRARTSKLRGCLSAREAEVLSFKEALTWTKRWRSRRCIFELDAKTVVDAVHGPRKNSNFHIIIEECVDLLKHFEEVLVIFDHRSANKVAHVLAQAAYSMPDPMEWYNATPDFICNLIAEDY